MPVKPTACISLYVNLYLLMDCCTCLAIKRVMLELTFLRLFDERLFVLISLILFFNAASNLYSSKNLTKILLPVIEAIDISIESRLVPHIIPI